jgi:hypothetical protein
LVWFAHDVTPMVSGQETGDTDGSINADIQFHFDCGIEQFLCGLAGTKKGFHRPHL